MSLNRHLRKEYIRLQNEAGFKAGDKVKLMFNVPDYTGGWPLVWMGAMNRHISETGTVKGVSSDGIWVQFPTTGDGGGYWYPYFCLERVETTYAKITIGEHEFSFNAATNTVKCKEVEFSATHLLLYASNALRPSSLTPLDVGGCFVAPSIHTFTLQKDNGVTCQFDLTTIRLNALVEFIKVEQKKLKN